MNHVKSFAKRSIAVLTLMLGLGALSASSAEAGWAYQYGTFPSQTPIFHFAFIHPGEPDLEGLLWVGAIFNGAALALHNDANGVFMDTAATANCGTAGWTPWIYKNNVSSPGDGAGAACPGAIVDGWGAIQP